MNRESAKAFHYDAQKEYTYLGFDIIHLSEARFEAEGRTDASSGSGYYYAHNNSVDTSSSTLFREVLRSDETCGPFSTLGEAQADIDEVIEGREEDQA